jgi:hypothetical protein
VSSPQIIELLPDLDESPEQISVADRRRIVDALRAHRSASDAFRRFIDQARP